MTLLHLEDTSIRLINIYGKPVFYRLYKRILNMLIEELTLAGYKRIMLNNINKITIKPESVVQIILGGNGSGKSSILDEWSPFPATPSDYIKGGSKRIVVRHAGTRYICLSDFSGKGHHSLVKVTDEGEIELNDGGTISVQRELVQQIFGLTPEIQDLLLGKILFTQMGPNQRRAFITKMSADDLTYATNLFNKVSSVARDNQGAMKHIKQRLSRETDNLLRLNADETLEETVALLQHELTLLMGERSNKQEQSKNKIQFLDNVQARLDSLYTAIMNNPFPTLNEAGFESPDAIREALVTKKATYQNQSTRLNELTTDYQKRKELFDLVAATGNIDVAELESLVQKYTADNESLSKKKKQFDFNGDVSDMLSSAQDFKSQLVEILMMLPDNSDGHLSRARLAELKDTSLIKEGEVNKLRNRLKFLDERISHIENSETTNCPKCGFTWRVGIRERELPDYQEERGKLVVQIKQIEKESESVNLEIEQINDYANLFTRLKTLFHSYPKASNLLDWLLEDKRICFNPSSYSRQVDIWMSDLHIAHKTYLNNKELRWIQDTLAINARVSNQSKEHIESGLHDLERTIEVLTDSQRYLLVEIDQLTHLLRLAIDFFNKGNEFAELKLLLKSTLDETVDVLRDEHIDKLIRHYQSQLATKVNLLNEKKAIEGIIQDLTNDLKNVEADYLANKRVAKALSPVDGIIAKQMMQFIEIMVEQMNDIIRNIWTTPLEVKVCGTEDGGLDYKFPLVSGHGAVSVKDITQSSKGQEEIINFSFRLVAIMYLGLGDFPLFLDEVGQNLDETHLTSLMNYVKMLMDGHRHSQLVMISHFAAFFGAFNLADVCVLSGANITAPAKHNEHVIIE